MHFRYILLTTSLFLSACGGDDALTLEDVTQDPGRKDVAKLCDLYVQQSASRTDQSADAGFDEMLRMGVSEKGVKKAREVREEGREDYVDGLEACCETFNDEVKDLNDTQTAYVYADLVLSNITTDLITPAQRRTAQTLRQTSQDNMTRPESQTAYEVRRSLPRCEKELSRRVSKQSQDAIYKIIQENR